jgi:hypothetical protein
LASGRTLPARDGAISGVVDWDHLGHGSHALDLTSRLFEWQRLRLASEHAVVVSEGGERLVVRIVDMVGEDAPRRMVALCRGWPALSAHLPEPWHHGNP